MVAVVIEWFSIRNVENNIFRGSLKYVLHKKGPVASLLYKPATPAPETFKLSGPGAKPKVCIQFSTFEFSPN